MQLFHLGNIVQFVDPVLSRNVLRTFGQFGVEIGLISPTATAMGKSIMDATAPFREFLRAAGIHDFEKQGQGEEFKIKLSASFVTSTGLRSTTISLYRPSSKEGDPRVWFYNLRQYAEADSILGIIKVASQLYIINTSDSFLMSGIGISATPLGGIVALASNQLNSVAMGLLGKLRAIKNQGFIPTVREGDTGVGATLEALLGIASNSSRKPDYHGIEIKASRQDEHEPNARNRVNLFSQVPDWKQSAGGSAYNVLQNYGYVREGRQQLYCSVSALKPNSQSLSLRSDPISGHLYVMHTSNDAYTNVMIWDLDKLKSRLLEKHPESFWVKAENRWINGVEHFRYHTVFHTERPLLSNLPQAIEDGVISVDLTMSDRGGRVRDHGYLFKIWPTDLEMLFPRIRVHTL